VAVRALPPTSARLAVVLGTYNRLASLRRCIDSILAETRTPTVIYVTDAGATDGTVEYLESIVSDAVVPILVGEKLGQARAYNDVFAAVRTPYVVWLSDDNEVVNGGLDAGVDTLDRRPSIGMVAIKVRDVEGPFVDAPYVGGVSTIGVLNVNQGMLRTHVVQQLGGFSERFRDYGIDPDLSAKVLFSGWELAYTRVVGIHHYRDWTESAGPAPQRIERPRAYQDLYAQKWATYAPPDRCWNARRRVWRLLQRITGVKSSSRRRRLGMDGRDLGNVLTARYVSLLDPLLTRGQPYHLVQRPPRDLRPLPPDPA
jgi:GT2 family glycosyltransferase